MDAIIAANTVPLAQAPVPPAAGVPGYPTDGVPGITPPTTFPAYHYSGLVQEILAVIRAGGLTPDRADLGQLLAAIQALSTGPSSAESLARVAGDTAEAAARAAADSAEATARAAADSAETAARIAAVTAEAAARDAGFTSEANARANADAATLLAAASDAQTRANSAQSNAESYTGTYAVARAGDTVNGPLYSYTYYTCGPLAGNYHPCASANIGVSISQQTIDAYNSFGACAEFGAGSSLNIINFYCAGNVIGSVYSNGNSVAFNTTSDYRLKVFVAPIMDALARVKSVPARRFAWSSDVVEDGPDPAMVDGFLAHEAAAGVPEAVVGDKDATRLYSGAVLSAAGNVLAEGVTAEQFAAAMALPQARYPAGAHWAAAATLPVYQAIDQSKLVPVLWAAVQELAALVAGQAVDIAALQRSGSASAPPAHGA